MIITLICCMLLVVGIVLIIIDNKLYICGRLGEVVEYGKLVLTALGVFLTMLTGPLCLGKCIKADTDYQNMLYKKEMLEYRIEHMEENITGNEMLYNDIVEFNNELRSEKKWANNPWTSWFNNKYIASIDYVELSKD